METREQIDFDESVKMKENLRRAKGVEMKEWPPEGSRACFWVVQVVLLLGLAGVIANKIGSSYVKVYAFNDSSSLLVNINRLQGTISHSSYLVNAILVELAYTTPNSLTLPYPEYHANINISMELPEFYDMLLSIQPLLAVTNPLLLDKVAQGELSYDSLQVNTYYLNSQGSQLSYRKTLSLVQAINQFEAYGRELMYRLDNLN
jgi:hypothetical protein